MATESVAPTLTLDPEHVECVRKALVIGLTCYGEIEKVIGHSELLKLQGRPLDPNAIPAHPTGSDDVVGTFATALAFMGLW